MQLNPLPPADGVIYGTETEAPALHNTGRVAAPPACHIVREEESLPMPPRAARESRSASKQTPPEDFLEETIRVWQPYSREPLSHEDAREILANVSGLFRVLRAWSEEDRRAALDQQK